MCQHWKIISAEKDCCASCLWLYALKEMVIGAKGILGQGASGLGFTHGLKPRHLRDAHCARGKAW